MGLATLKSDLLAFESALAEKSPAKIIRASATILNDVADVAELFSAGPNDESDKAECCEIIKRCHRKCNEPQTMAAVEGPVGKLFPGDGSFLKVIGELFIKLLQLFVKPAPGA